MIPSILSFPSLDFFLIPILLPLANIGFIYKSLRAASLKLQFPEPSSIPSAIAF